MRKRRIGTAKFFTLLLLLYHTSANAAQFYALLDEQPLLKNQDDTLCAILNEEAAPYFAGHCDEQTAAANMQARAKLYLMEQVG